MSGTATIVLAVIALLVLVIVGIKLMKKLIIVAFVLLALGILVLIAAFYFSMNQLVKQGVERVGPGVTGTSMTLAGVKISPLSGKGEVREFVVGNPSGYQTPNALKVSKVHLGLAPTSLMGKKIVIKEVYVDGAELTYERSAGSSNIEDIRAHVEKILGEASGSEKEGQPSDGDRGEGRKLQIDHLVMKNVKVKLSAGILKGDAISLSLPDIELNDIGQGPEGATPAEVAKAVVGSIWKGLRGKLTDAGAIVGKGIEKLGGSAEGIGEKAKEGAGKALSKFKGFLNKDKDKADE